MIWPQQTSPKFCGTSLINHGENYVMHTPKLLIGFIPVPRTNWTGNVTIHFTGNSFLGFGGNNRSVKGRIVDTSTSKTIYEVDRHWDGAVMIKDVMNKQKTKTVIYNGKEALSKLKTPEVKDVKGLWTGESALVWIEVSQSILNKDWEKAREAKLASKQERKTTRKREEIKRRRKQTTQRKNKYYECLPKQKCVPPAPIVCM
ncbi:hypothetical protein MKX01_005032 [Papaver californicum]|nr:hypothetical protein MKX01_005032 [Papaver californicum]